MKLGQKVSVSATFDKTKTREQWQKWTQVTHTRWVRNPIEIREAIYIGARTVCNCDFTRSGIGDPDSYDENIHVMEHFRVYLVVFSTRENPVYVFPDDCKELEAQS